VKPYRSCSLCENILEGLMSTSSESVTEAVFSKSNYLLQDFKSVYEFSLTLSLPSTSFDVFC
jgi:hypothetical protein